MSGVNKVILVGHLGRDPDVRRTQDGRPVVSFSVATSERWRDKATGEQRDHTDWHQVVIFNEGLAKVAEQYLRKGSKVYVEGAQKTRKWTDQKGVDRYLTEVILGAFGAQLAMLDRAERAPGPETADYGRASEGPPPDAPPDIQDEIAF